MEEREQFKQLFGKHLRAKRKAADLSLDDLAKETNINGKHLGRIERGEKEPLLLTVTILRSVLHMDVNATLDDICSELDERFED